MKKQKEVSTLSGTIIIIVAALIIFGGAVMYQNFVMQKMISVLSGPLSTASLLK